MNTASRFQQTFTDNNADGIADSVLSAVYNNNGNLAGESLDVNADGKPDEVTTYTYDSLSNPTGKFIDYSSPLTATDYSLLSEYTYDAVGNLTITYTDGPNNFFDTGTYIYSFNTDGNPLSRKTDNRSAAFGTFSEDEDYTYNESGQVASFINNISGFRTNYSYTYNEAGDVATVEAINRTPDNPSSTLNRTEITTNRYDSAGNLIEKATVYSYPDESSGQFNPQSETTTYAYDASGNLTQEIYALESSFFADPIITYVYDYAYDAAGNRVREAFDFSRNGSFEYIKTYAYDAAGNLIYEANDRNGDGQLDEIITRTFSDTVPVVNAADDAFATENDVLLVGNVFADNGSGVDSDPKGTAFKVTEVNGTSVVGDAITLASGALLRIAADGAFAYDPNGQFDNLGLGDRATDTFSYAIADVVGNTETATVTVEIAGSTIPNVSSSLERQYTRDANGDGIPESTTVYTYDDAGSLIRRLDVNGGGDRNIEETTYDAAGNRISESYDRNGDGIPESLYTYAYDAAGNQTYRSDDNDGDGIIDAIYTSFVKIDESGNRTSRSTTDSNGDGIIDSSLTTIVNANGDLTGQFSDDDGDGIIDSSFTATYDEAGNQTRQSFDYDGDGIFDTTFYTYDAAGNLTSQSSDTNGDGIIDSSSTYRFNAAGNPTLDTFDSDGDGTIDGSTVYRYDEADNLISRSSLDGNGDPVVVDPTGIVASSETFTYDAAGNLIRSVYDNDGDGTADRIFTFAYDAAGNRILEAFDFDGDGIIERGTAATYDAAGNQTSQSYDTDGDGRPNSTNFYTYDAAGNQTSSAYDFNGDGLINSRETTTYDAAGNVTERTRDNNGDGIPNFVLTLAYNEAGDNTLMTTDRDGDGSIDSTSTYTYDKSGNLVSQSDDTNGDGRPDRILTQTYDAVGNLIHKADDTNGDGTPDVVETNTYILPADTVIEIEPTIVTELSSTYDSAGNLTIDYSVSENTGGGGISLFSYTFDAAGNQIQERRDYSADGTTDYLLNSSYAYDDMGNLTITYQADDNGDGTVESIYTYRFNTAGEQIEETIDYGNDGQIDYRNLIVEGGVSSLISGSLLSGVSEPLDSFSFPDSDLGENSDRTLLSAIGIN